MPPLRKCGHAAAAIRPCCCLPISWPTRTITGDTSHYYDIKNSDVGYVLATGCGLPITLCVLHRAVGQAGGLDIQLLNTPGHVVNAISFARTGSGGGSGGTAAVAADFGVVDPFDGGKELTDGRLRCAHRLHVRHL
jgi:hypothetical protein